MPKKLCISNWTWESWSFFRVNFPKSEDMNENATSLRKSTQCEPSAINSPLVNLHKLNCCKFSAQNCDKTCVLLAGKSCNVIICIIARIRKRQNSTISRFVFPVYYKFSPNRIKVKASINFFKYVFLLSLHEFTSLRIKILFFQILIPIFFSLIH